ncbi:PREDICTED: protein RRNAD1-like [Dufourea novaeangliae]|uniref:Protein RRNAD1 n=1 Tax=Dufourea novaeangliae TaxID=178035 RepID=A0A154NWW3_DUFNO|nr:PREDICTED: protein RRNAD1-like [Dufourea novaeangliae]KZC04159.1 Protein RRNAD1 [Dufourea novaeangliae]
MAASVEIQCTCRVCTNIRLTIDNVFCVLDVYGWLLNSYVVDFFQEKLWDKLPESWRFALHDVSPREFGKWLSGDISCTQVWPLSLLALRQVTNSLKINRDHGDPASIISCKLDSTKRNKEETNKKFQSTKSEVLDKSNSQDRKFTNLFSKHIKKKKRYEIQELAHVCADCAYESNCKCIVDIGAGMGHLARTLAFQHGLCVTCIEQDSTLLQQARKWDQELLMSAKKHLLHFCEKVPQHYTAKLESSNLVESELVGHLQNLFQNGFNLCKTDAKFGLIGLHSCGDLAPLLLKLYSSRCEAKFICIVGCCYMKLSLKSQLNELNGYPLSKYLRSCKNHTLSYTSLEVACHAIEKYCDKLKTGNYEDLIVHTYRAALETILIKKSEKLRHSQLRNVKVRKGMTFQQYCDAATSYLDTYLQPEDSDINSPDINAYLNRWKEVIVFGSLRMMLAPLVETIVLLDRFLFLSEKNLSPTLKPVFDSRLSPRNLVLISKKNN